MRTNHFFIILLLFVMTADYLSAQESARERDYRQLDNSRNNEAVTLSVRAKQMNRNSQEDLSDAKWSRVIYRYLDLSKEKNASLYYPVIPEGGRMNLFTLIFKLLIDNQITAYEYLDGRELFTDEYKIDIKEFLDRFGVYYETDGNKIIVNDVDIPSNEVQGYFVKEAYFFETGTSNYGVKTVSICPVMLRQDDYDANMVRYPLFWIPYDEIMPYTLQMPMIASELNNSMTGNINDFFRKREYDGEIYKTMNPRNLSLSQYAGTPEEMKKEQQKIEQQLQYFEEKLWKNENDSTLTPIASKKRKVKKSKVKSSPSVSANSMRERRY